MNKQGKQKQKIRKPKAKEYGKAQSEMLKLAKMLTKHLRDYQKRVDIAQDNFMNDPETFRAMVNSCTGSGKTEMFMVLIKKMVLLAKTHSLKKILIAHPRLVLSFDQQKRIKQAFKEFSVEFTHFGSGKVIDTNQTRKNVSTILKDTLVERMDTCTQDVHITFSSYKSLSKIADLKYDLIICDEAHHLVDKTLRKVLYQFRKDVKVLFYTATPIKVAAKEHSMDNVELFGKVIAKVPPSELIPNGYVVAPKVRFGSVKTESDGDIIDYPTTIARAYVDQLQFVHPDFNHKMLVAMPNTKYFSYIMEGLDTIRNIVGDDDIDFYSVAHDKCYINGRPYKDREFVLKHFAENTNQCIIIHCDTLAEGIDVDGIGGVLMLRNLGFVKTIQTIGRACRPALQDINANGSIKPMDKRVKKNAIVTLGIIDGELVNDPKAKYWAELFETAGYGKLWELLHEMAEREGVKPGETDPEDYVVKQIEDMMFGEEADALIELMNSQIAQKQVINVLKEETNA